MQEHRAAAILEDVDFLLERGLHIDLVAHRLGISRSQVDKMIERRTIAQRDTSRVTEPGRDQGVQPVPAVRVSVPSSEGAVASP